MTGETYKNLPSDDGAAVNAAWTVWTPVLTGSTTSPTLGVGGGVDGRYKRIGKMVFANFTISFGSSGTNQGSGTYTLSLPVTANNSDKGIGNCWILNSGTSNMVLGLCRESATGTFIIYVPVTSGTYTVGSGIPFNWTTSCFIQGSLAYEAA